MPRPNVADNGHRSCLLRGCYPRRVHIDCIVPLRHTINKIFRSWNEFLSGHWRHQTHRDRVAPPHAANVRHAAVFFIQLEYCQTRVRIQLVVCNQSQPYAFAAYRDVVHACSIRSFRLSVLLLEAAQAAANATLQRPQTSRHIIQVFDPMLAARALFQEGCVAPRFDRVVCAVSRA